MLVKEGADSTFCEEQNVEGEGQGKERTQNLQRERTNSFHSGPTSTSETLEKVFMLSPRDLQIPYSHYESLKCRNRLYSRPPHSGNYAIDEGMQGMVEFNDHETSKKDDPPRESCNNRPLKLSWLEHIQLVANAWAFSLKQEHERTKKMLQNSQQRVIRLCDQLEFHTQEQERLVREASRQQAEFSSLKEQLEHARARLQDQEGRGKLHDDLVTRMHTAETKAADRAQGCHLQNKMVENMRAENETLKRQTEETMHGQHMLSLDKAFLMKELEERKAKHVATQHALTVAEERIQRLLAVREDCTRQLQEVKDEAEAALQRRVDEERSRAAAEEKRAKVAMQELWERERGLLREERQAACREAERVRQELQALRYTYDDLVLRCAKQDSTAQATISTLKADATYKALELVRVETQLEGTTQDLRAAQRSVMSLQAQAQTAPRTLEARFAPEKGVGPAAAVADVGAFKRSPTRRECDGREGPEGEEPFHLMATLQDAQLQIQQLLTSWRGKGQGHGRAGDPRKEGAGEWLGKRGIDRQLSHLMFRMSSHPRKAPKWHMKI